MIHIVDDDPNVRDGLTTLLRSVGFDCNTFKNAELFLENYKAGTNDLLILDIHLTGMNGCALLEYLARNDLILPIIVVTAYDEQATRTAVKNYGALAYLRKPVDSDALIDLIKFNFADKIN